MLGVVDEVAFDDVFPLAVVAVRRFLVYFHDDVDRPALDSHLHADGVLGEDG